MVSVYTVLSHQQLVTIVHNISCTQMSYSRCIDTYLASWMLLCGVQGDDTLTRSLCGVVTAAESSSARAPMEERGGEGTAEVKVQDGEASLLPGGVCQR